MNSFLTLQFTVIYIYIYKKKLDSGRFSVKTLVEARNSRDGERLISVDHLCCCLCCCSILRDPAILIKSCYRWNRRSQSWQLLRRIAPGSLRMLLVFRFLVAVSWFSVRKKCAKHALSLVLVRRFCRFVRSWGLTNFNLMSKALSTMREGNPGARVTLARGLP